MKNPIDDFTDKFHSFEETKISTKNWEKWDGIRFMIYMRLLDLLSNEHQTEGNNKTRLSIYNKIKKAFLGLKIISKILLRKKILIISASRFKNPVGKWYDPNITDILNLYKNNVVILDNWIYISDYAFDACMNSLIPIYRRCINVDKKYGTFIDDIRTKIFDYFHLDITERYIKDCLLNYISEKTFYKHLLKLLKPKIIFVIQSGPQQAIFRVARDENIPIIELQHGNVYYSHISYSYPANISKDQLSIPNYFFAFSEFWKKKIENTYPVEEIIVSGNSDASSMPNFEKIYDVTFVTNSKYTPQFIDLIKGLREKGYQGRICLKLHPHQIKELSQIKRRLFDRGLIDIDIILVEYNIKDIISKSRNMVMIHSTTIYEALDAGVNVYLYKDGLHAGLEDIFSHPLISLFNDSTDLINLISKKGNCGSKEISGYRFFEPFHKDTVKGIIDGYL